MSAAVTGRNALVTGAAGFIGSHLVDRFLARGWCVEGVDNLVSGARANLAEASTSTTFAFRECDVIDPFVPDETPGMVVNLACPASPPRYQANPLHTFRTNVIGTLNMAELAHRAGARLVHTSTSEVYGEPEVHPQTEEYRGAVNPIGPRSCYDEGKRAAEAAIFSYHRQLGLDIGICRIFNTYGPRMDPYDGRVVSNFLRQALLGEPLTIYGKGEQTRSFCYVDDLVDGLWRLCHSPGSTGPFNLGNPAEMTILELAEMVKGLVGGSVRIEFKPLPTDDPTRRRPDVGRARDRLGWTPKIPPEEGLKRTLDYFDDLIASARIEDYAAAHRERFKTAAE